MYLYIWKAAGANEQGGLMWHVQKLYEFQWHTQRMASARFNSILCYLCVWILIHQQRPAFKIALCRWYFRNLFNSSLMHYCLLDSMGRNFLSLSFVLLVFSRKCSGVVESTRWKREKNDPIIAQAKKKYDSFWFPLDVSSKYTKSTIAAPGKVPKLHIFRVLSALYVFFHTIPPPLSLSLSWIQQKKQKLC